MGFFHSITHSLKHIGHSLGKTAGKLGKTAGKVAKEVAETGKGVLNNVKNTTGLLNPKNIMVYGALIIGALIVLPSIIDSLGSASEKVGNTRAAEVIAAQKI